MFGLNAFFYKVHIKFPFNLRLNFTAIGAILDGLNHGL